MSKFNIDKTSVLSIETSVLLAMCESIDSPRSLAIYMIVKNECWEEYLSLSIDPNNYDNDVRSFALDYLVTEVMQKSKSIPVKLDRRQLAIDSFKESEENCHAMNIKFRNNLVPKTVIHNVSNQIFKMIGPLTALDLDEITSSFKHGSGATTGVVGSGSVTSDKYDNNVHLTADLIPFYRAILQENWHSYADSPIIVPGSKFTTVPKNAKTDRGICIEPTLNMYVQLGIGTYLKKLLLRSTSIDLHSQERNRYLASRAQILGLATIDLSQASDSISWECVRALLPHRWFELLDLCRSKRVLIDGVDAPLEKFSSMGNGFTFELETAIFAAVVRSVVPEALHNLTTVYGDDIIVPQNYAEAVIDVLNHLGFRTNIKKSFLAGCFFESCGSDWYYSTNVRPFYFRTDINDKQLYIMQLANRIRLYSLQLGLGFYCDDIFRKLWVALYTSVSKNYKDCKVPEEFGDAGFITSRDEAKPQRLKYGHQGYRTRIVLRKPVYIRKDTVGVLFSSLARLSPGNNKSHLVIDVIDLFTGGREPKRGFLRSLSTKFVPVFNWDNRLLWKSN